MSKILSNIIPCKIKFKILTIKPNEHIKENSKSKISNIIKFTRPIKRLCFIKEDIISFNSVDIPMPPSF